MTLENAFAFFQSLKEQFPRALSRGFEISRGGTPHEPHLNMTGRLFFYALQPSATMDSPEKNYMQGFHCIELEMRVSWGGATVEGRLLIEPRISIKLIDRREYSDGPRRYFLSGQWDDSEIATFPGICLLSLADVILFLETARDENPK